MKSHELKDDDTLNIEVVEMELGEGFLVERRDSSHFAFLAMFSSYLKVNIETMHWRFSFFLL